MLICLLTMEEEKAPSTIAVGLTTSNLERLMDGKTITLSTEQSGLNREILFFHAPGDTAEQLERFREIAEVNGADLDIVDEAIAKVEGDKVH